MPDDWTREQAICDAIQASDGFGRVYGPDLETPPHLEDFQPCVVRLAREIVYRRRRRAEYAKLEVQRCARPGCPVTFKRKRKKLYCSMTCGIREQRRLRAARLRQRG